MKNLNLLIILFITCVNSFNFSPRNTFSLISNSTTKLISFGKESFNIHSKPKIPLTNKDQIKNSANKNVKENVKNSTGSFLPGAGLVDKLLPNKNASDDEEHCYPPLGCFKKSYYSENSIPTVGYFWPDSLEKLNIRIIHFYKENLKGQSLFYNTTEIKNYIQDGKVYFLIHGWKSDYTDSNWMDQLKDTILRINNNTVNVFVVDWSEEASSIIYPISAANTKLIGRSVGYFITNTLIPNYNLDCENIHVIGHSLGGQTAGFVGKYTKTKNCLIKRITALDPAGPFFRTDKTEDRIDKEDGYYVEAIHTNAAPLVIAGLGTVIKSGTIDFYPNGGSVQNGCEISDQAADIVKKGIIESLNGPSCSHSRAQDLYITDYGKLAKCQLVAYQCKDYDTFKNGLCGSCGSNNEKCRLIGLFSKYDPTNLPLPTSNDSFYVQTTESAPFCQYYMQVIAYVSSKTGSNVLGSLNIDILGKARDAKNLKISKLIKGFSPNTTEYLLASHEFTLGELKTIEVYFSDNIVNNLLDKFKSNEVYIDKIEVNYMSHIEKIIRDKLSGVFCPTSEEQISRSDKNKSVFKRCYQNY